MDKETQIRERAHQIWQEEGRPDGKAEEHWERARRMLDTEDTKASESGTGGARSGVRQRRGRKTVQMPR